MNCLEQYFNLLSNQLAKPELNLYKSTLNNDSYRAINLNILKQTSIEYIDGLLDKHMYYKNGYYITPQSKAGKSIFHDLGAYYIQEPSAMIPAVVLNPKNNEKVLDICAAPGGKTAQLAMLMNNQGLLVANEISRNRAILLNSNVKRLGIKNTIVSSMDIDMLNKNFNNYFDAILLDAPCSGEGMFRKNSQAINEWSLQKVYGNAKRQYELLTKSFSMLKPGGRLVYSTCTLNNVENEENVNNLIKNICNCKLNKFILGDKIINEGYIKIWPNEFKGEGHFIANFKNNYEDNFPKIKNKISNKSIINKNEISIFNEFCSENNILGFYPNYKFNNILMQIPTDIDFANLNIVDAGVRLGKIKNNIFVPEHTFAQAINCLNGIKNIELNKEEMARYVAGETLTFNNLNYQGYILLSYKQLSLSWGKIKNGIIKNHYPKHLRKIIHD